jgi:Arc/MetJ family transcription regulator
MATHMKTTIQIADSLIQEARRVAERENTTLRALVEQGLRRTLAERKTRTGFRLRKASFRGNGLQPAFAGRSWEEIRSASYEGHGG